MLWLLLILLLSALGVLWWRFAMPGSTGAAVASPLLEGNHPSLRTRHYRLADFHPAPFVAPQAGSATDAAAAESRPEAAPQPSPPAPAQPPVAAVASEHPTATQAPAPPAEAGRLPAGALHNYLTAPAPTATDAHNREVELTAAERRARMRSVMTTALQNHRPAPATA